MFKKVLVTAILLSLLIAGNIFAIDKDPLIIHVVAQEEVDWTLYIDDPLPNPWIINWYGTKNINADGCQGCPYEMWAMSETIFIESGNLPYSNWFEIVIPITVPSEEDQEQ